MQIDWNDSFRGGIESIDTQHHKLVKLVNDLGREMLRGRGSKVLLDVLGRLSDYTAFHFKAEEDLMKKHNYPDYEKHQGYHLEFKRELAEYVQRYRKGDSLLHQDVFRFIKNWVLWHIRDNAHEVDKKLARYLLTKGVR